MDPLGFLTTIVIWSLTHEIETNKQAIEQAQKDSVYIETEISRLDKENEELENHMAMLEENFNSLYEDYLRLGSSHAATSARDTVRYDQLKEEINNIVQQINNTKNKTQYLDEKINLLHP